MFFKVLERSLKSKMRYKWRVQHTKKMNWVAWRVGSKRTTGQVFANWKMAYEYAYTMSGIDRLFLVHRLGPGL
jgi:hypothetical protein